MASTWCIEQIDPATLYVDQAHGKFMDLGTQTYNLAVGNLNGLNNIHITPVDFNVGFQFDGQLTPFRRPPRPDIDDTALDFRPPDVPIGPAPTFVAAALPLTPAPEFSDLPPSLTFGGKPQTPDIPMPPPPNRPAPLLMPDAPNYVPPPVPTMESLRLPDVPVIALPPFTTERPEFVEPTFIEHWSFAPTAYAQTLVDELVTTLRPMIVGSPSLPQAIERALFERGRSRIEVETNRAVEQTIADFAARGFSEPPGQLAGRVSELRQAGHNSIAETSRDVAIKQFEETLASQRFAITQGAALEGTLVELHIREQQMLLQAGQFQRESTLAVLNYRVQVFGMKLQAYQTDAAVLRDRIAAELSKLELFRAQIEGERARGEINAQRAQLYESQWRGVQAMADVYKTRVAAVQVVAETQTQEITRFKAEVDAYGERWRAHTSEWQGYIASVEGEGKRADLYRTLVDANAKRVDAWATSSNLQFEGEKLRMAQHGVSVDVWRTGLQRLEGLLATERARLGAAGAAVDAKSRIYQADASVETAASAAADRSFELGLRREQAAVETDLKVAEMRVQQALGLLAQALEVQKAKAQISSQLAASTMSAVNYGASISGSRSRSTSCSQNFSFQGEIADA